MRTLKQIDEEISQQENEVKTKLSALLEERKKYFAMIFDDSKFLQTAIKNSENASMYGADDSGIYSWYRVDLSKFEDCIDELRAYLSDLNIGLDDENECFTHNLGPCIVINDDGDVFDQDSSKCIVDRDDYSDEAERNKLIEAWMDKNGYYPGVFRVDRDGQPGSPVKVNYP